MTDQITPGEPPILPAMPVPPAPEEHLVTGGWCTPSDNAFGFLDLPSVTAQRGGLSFTQYRDPYADLSKKQLRKLLDERTQALGKVRRENGKLKRKVARLVKIIGRIA